MALPTPEQDSLDSSSKQIARILFEKPSGDERPTLLEQVKPWETGLGLSTNIRETVRGYVTPRLPDLKRNLPLLANLDDKHIGKAVIDNVFNDIDSSDPDLELLLLRTGDVVKRFETDLYIDVLKSASPEALRQLNLNPALRDLTTDLLSASVNANSLFINFMEFAHNTPDPPTTATQTSFYLPNEVDPKTIASVFPNPTQVLAEGFDKVLENSSVWENEPNGQSFKEYLMTLAALFRETDPKKAEEIQEKVETQYGELLKTDFPVVLTPGLLGYFKQPYIDPELKVSLATPDVLAETEQYKKARAVMAESLDSIGVADQWDNLAAMPIKGTISIGGFGVNLRFPTPAQARPSIIVYLNEELWQYDQNFPDFIQKVINTDGTFGDLEDPETRLMLEFMCRMNTVLHELSHGVFPSNGPESKRLGASKSYTAINETKADVVYRALVNDVVQKGGLPGTSEQWAQAMFASGLQEVPKDSEDPYLYSASYPLNSLFEQGVVVPDGERFKIVDFDKYYATLKQAARDLLVLYKDPESNEQKAADWLKTHATPSEKTSQALAKY